MQFQILIHFEVKVKAWPTEFHQSDVTEMYNLSAKYPHSFMGIHFSNCTFGVITYLSDSRTSPKNFVCGKYGAAITSLLCFAYIWFKSLCPVCLCDRTFPRVSVDYKASLDFNRYTGYETRTSVSHQLPREAIDLCEILIRNKSTVQPQLCAPNNFIFTSWQNGWRSTILVSTTNAIEARNLLTQSTGWRFDECFSIIIRVQLLCKAVLQWL